MVAASRIGGCRLIACPCGIVGYRGFDMPHSSRRRAIALSLFGALFCCATGSAQEAPTPVSFSKDIVPILTASCTGCHQPDKKKAGLDLSTHKAALVGAKDGPAIIPGDPDK